uniref:Inhibitor of growth protein n=1 Tax=Anopheles atroparvus TaxID=41427 RepID=A0AAG5DNI1_ANOAO
MLHLEDYLEMIEHLPQELRDRFTEMREMDLSVQNNTDALDKRARSLFQQCRRGELPTAAADAEFDAIRSDYYRVLEDSDEKIQLAGQMYDLVERYQRRLDTELYKFKCELEADHNGITEILEKRSLELDINPTSNGGTNQKENRFYDAQHSYSGSGAGRADSRYKLKAVRRRESVAVTAAEKRAAAAAVAAAAAAAAASSASTSNVVPITNAHIRPRTPSVACAGIGSGSIGSHPLVASASAGNVATYNLQICGAGNAIAAAASQAIAQTQQMQQGRRTASLKASYEAIGAMGSQELLINSELAGATHNALQAVERESNVFSNQRRQKKKSTPSTNTSAAGARGIPTVKVLSNNATVTPILTPNQLAQASFTLQVQQSPLQQQMGSVPGALVHPQQQQQQQQQQQPVTIAQTTQFTVQQQPISVQQQIQLHHTNTQVPLQHLQQVPHQQPILQQLSVQQQPSQPLQQSTTIKQLLPQQIQIANMNNQQQKHIILPQTSQSQQRLPRPQQPQQFQQSLQSPVSSMTTQLLQQTPQQVPGTSQQASQQQLTLQQLPLQSLSQPQLIQAQASHSLPLSQPSQVQLQQLQQQLVHSQAQQKQQLQQLKTIQHQSLQPLAQTQQQHIVQQQVVHLQSQQTQLQQLQPLQQHHHIQITQQQLQQQQQTSQQTSQQLVQHQQLQISQQQQPQQQQQLQQPQQLQISQQQQHQHQLIELQQKDSQLQQTIQQQQVLQQQQQQQQLLQQTQQQPQLQVQHHLIQQQLPSQKQQSQQQKLIQQQQQQLQQQQLQVQPQQQFIAGHTSSGVLANVPTTMELSMAANIPSTSLGSLEMSRTSTSSTSGTSSVVLSDAGMVVEQTPEGEWSYDPNEPRYCICNQVSYGDMVACDNEDCPFEWFHYPCVNITSSPKGKWYCPQCSSSMKRRASRKN